MSKQGFIMLHRSIQEHWIYDEKRKFSKYEAWLDMLMMANHSESKFVLGNELIELKAGQFVTSIRKLGERWEWSNTKVTQFLDLLNKDEMLLYKKDTKKTLITIVKYGFYQGKDEEKKTPKEHKNDAKTTQKHTNNNYNNVKNEKNDNNKKPSSRKYEIYDMELAQHFYSLILENNENAKQPNFEVWANDIRLMRERDIRTEEQIKYLMDWTQNDEFWKSNILSPSKLREKFDQLVIKVKSDIQKKNKRVGRVDKPLAYSSLEEWAEGEG
jgi:hypothetical protein